MARRNPFLMPPMPRITKCLDRIGTIQVGRKSVRLSFAPCLLAKVPDRPERLHEIKHDGYRLIVLGGS